MTLCVDASLVQFAHSQNTQLAANIKNQIFWVNFTCALALVCALILSIVSAQEKVNNPLFYKPSESIYLAPQLNTPPSRQFVTAVAERWASELMTIHFSRAQQQVMSRAPLFYEGRFTNEYLTPMRQGMLNQVIEQKAVITTVPTCFNQFKADSGSIAGVCGAKLNAIYVKDGHQFYDYTIPLIQTRLDLSGEPSSRIIKFYLTLISVPQSTQLEGIQIYSSGFNHRTL